MSAQYIESRGIKMRRIVLWMATLALAFAFPAPAVSSVPASRALPGTTVDGEELYRFCTTDHSAAGYYEARMYCRGFVIGAIDTTSIYYPTVLKIRPFCVPVGLPTDEVTKVVAGYIQSHPAEKRWSAATEVLFALKSAFPCAK